MTAPPLPSHIQSECGKIRTRITPNTDTFYAVAIKTFKKNKSPSADRIPAETLKVAGKTLAKYLYNILKIM